MKRPTDAVGICVDLEGFGRVELELSFTRLKKSSIVDQ